MSTTDQQQSLEIVAPDRGISPSSVGNPGQVTDTLKRAMERGHLVSPSTTCGNLPIGYEVAFSSVLINRHNTGEVYPIPGSKKLGLSKPALDRISKGIGISWDAVQSQRTDDGKDPFFASYRAVGWYRAFDGSPMIVIGEKQMDLREGSEAARTMTPGNLSMSRKFIAEHAETKARLRAIRSLGIQTAYDPEELDKPFVMARLMMGQIDPAMDPTGELNKLRMTNIDRAMLSATSTLFPQPRDIEPPQLPSGTEHVELVGGEEARVAEVKPEPPTAPEPTFCTAEKCYSNESDGHIKACAGKKPTEDDDGFPREQLSRRVICTGDACYGAKSDMHTSACGANQQSTPPPMDVMEKALSSQIDSFVSQLEREGLTEEEASVLIRDRKVLEDALEAHRASKKK